MRDDKESFIKFVQRWIVSLVIYWSIFLNINRKWNRASNDFVIIVIFQKYNQTNTPQPKIDGQLTPNCGCAVRGWAVVNTKILSKISLRAVLYAKFHIMLTSLV